MVSKMDHCERVLVVEVIRDNEKTKITEKIREVEKE